MKTEYKECGKFGWRWHLITKWLVFSVLFVPKTAPLKKEAKRGLQLDLCRRSKTIF